MNDKPHYIKQYSILKVIQCYIHFNQIGFRTKYPHKGLLIKVQLRKTLRHRNVPNIFEQFKKMSWTIWVDCKRCNFKQLACRLLVGEIWRSRKESHFATWVWVWSSPLKIQSSPRYLNFSFEEILLWFFFDQWLTMKELQTRKMSPVITYL